MKKKYLKCIFAFILGLMLFASNKVVATTYSSDYTIDSYDINMIVNEDNTFDITETITVYFNVAKHGINRKIPLKNTVTRTDGTESSNRAKITNLSVSENYTTSNSSGYKNIKIGNSNRTITGSHTYTIKYTYDIGKDPLKDADELYFNLIGDEWDTSISNITFRITMPKEFDESSLGFSSGSTGSTNSSNVSYTVKGNVISGSYTGKLYAGQALTVRLTLPEGYFVGASSNIDFYPILVIVLCAVFVVIADILWAKYGKDDEVIETVEFYPPEGYNSAEVGFLYKGVSDDYGVISLLIYLANKGYLKIEETEQKVMFSKSKSFKIIKLKEYDGDNEYEKMFFKGLFKSSKIGNINVDKAIEIMKEARMNGEKITFAEATEMLSESNESKEVVTISDLYDRFYTTLNKIKAKLNSNKNKNKIFESSASGKTKWVILMIIAIFLLITIKPLVEYGEIEDSIPSLIFPLIGFAVLIGTILSKSPTITKLFGIIWGLGFGAIPWIMVLLPAIKDNTMYMVMFIIGLICVAVLILFAKIMPKRTPYGTEMLGKLRGFKRFLETAEKPQLEVLVKENPEYFYNVLPYTYALGVSDVWMKQFETIAMKAPDWYDCQGPFDMHEFNHFMSHTMASAQSAMTSSPSSDSGGGSSGGGSSGGGSGGGGGSSW
jgi:uncharacterized membrane protein